MRLDQFDYVLPPELIAQSPADPRDAARLMVVYRDRAHLEHRTFRDLPVYLRPGDVLVLNDTRVLPARLRARKATGGMVEVLLVRPLHSQVWEALIRPSRRVRDGARLTFARGLIGTVGEARPDGVRVITFASDQSVLDLIREIGELPLPPYIHEPLRSADAYQTVYATVEGAIAAPTAGLHFTPTLLDRIRALGVRVVTLTMHIGPGTFRPVSNDDVAGHRMDAEWYQVSPEAAAAINAVRARSLTGGRVVVVGTSAVRALETVANDDGTVRPGQGWTDLFIYPGFRFRATDILVTNFHLPRTTLLLLVSAFAGRELILHAYDEAIRRRYRFYSFGDAMTIL